MTDASLFLSVVVPLADDADLLEPFLDELAGIVRAGWANHEILLVDDASRDGTRALVERLSARHACLRYLRLARHAGPELAILAGLDNVIGDVVVVLQPESDPPALLPRFVERARACGGVVAGVSTGPPSQGFVYRVGQRTFAALARGVLDADVRSDATLYTAFTRPALNAMGAIKDRSRALRLYGAVIGWPREVLEYAPVARRGAIRRKRVMEGLERGVSILVTNSTRPLRWVSLLGFLGSVLNLLYILYVVAIALFKERVAEGWITLSLSISGMFFLLFAILAVLAEYVGRLLDETRDRPLYHVAEELTSPSMLADATRRNVVHETR